MAHADSLTVAAIKSRLAKQDSYSKWIQNFTENTRKTKAERNMTVSDYKTRVNLLERYWSAFLDNHLELNPPIDEVKTHLYYTSDVHNATVEAYLTSLAWHQDRIGELTAPASAPTTQTPLSPPGFNISNNLENVKIPKFSGCRKDWHTYREKFLALVYNDQTAMPIMKFNRLLNSLEGEPLELLREIQVVGTNFQTAWDAICDRYDDKLVRFNLQMKLLVDLPAATSESASHLTTLTNVANTSINIFRSLGRPVDKWDDIFVYHVESKLAPQTRLDWAKERENNQNPFAAFSELVKFLKTRLRTLERVDPDNTSISGADGVAPRSKHPSSQKKSAKPPKNHKNSSSFVAVPEQAPSKSNGPKSQSKCILCKESHYISRCPNFAGLSVPDRKNLVISRRLCFNCLGSNHGVDACSSNIRCLVCQGKHHSRLHPDATVERSPPSKVTSSEDTSVKVTNTATAVTKVVQTEGLTATIGNTKILTTALILLESPTGASYLARALLDSCSEESYIAEHVAQALCLPTRPAYVAVNGLGEATSIARNWVTFNIKSKTDTSFSQQVNALVLKRLTSLLPRSKVALEDWSYLDGLVLADPHCGKPGRIDCLLGTEIFANVLRDGLIPGPPGAPTALSTVFGWILMGGTNKASENQVTNSSNLHLSVDQELSQALTKFWEVEEPRLSARLSPDDERCYNHFRDTVESDSSGRLIVRLPFAKQTPILGSREIAVACLHRMERRFQRQPKIRDSYIHFMDEYLRLGHMERVPDAEVNGAETYYIPHHPVFKGGDCAKIRVVFNASQLSGNNTSLNHLLLAGPNLMIDIRTILILWRFNRYVFSCDVVKMFRQFLVHPSDRDWQRIVWRSSPEQPIQHFRLNTVTYGTVSAPFLANACMLTLADREEKTYPLGANAIRKNRYVDDFYVGADSIEDLSLQADQLVKILTSAGMSVGKWSSNNPQLLSQIENSSSQPLDIAQADDDSVATLGLLWNPIEDYFHFKHTHDHSDQPASKRRILSQIARLFDPLGYLSPFIIRAKILLQSLWLAGIDWDTSLSPLASKAWQDFRSDLPSIEEIRVPRWIHLDRSRTWELHAFCDASERAYAAALYAVSRSEEGKFSNLLIAKTKVSPLKVLNVPRLELCGALLLAQLIDFTLPTLESQPSHIHCWSDSEIVLAWLKGHPSRWKTFTANRVSEILTLIPSASWLHVPSRDNPADCASRGLSANELKDFELWWNGPSWLLSDSSQWPAQNNSSFETSLELKKESQNFVATPIDLSSWSTWIEKFSSIHRLARVLAYIHRWKINARTPQNLRRKTWLSAQEINQGFIMLWRLVQRIHYDTEFRALQQHQVVSTSSSLRRLSPFVDPDGLIRVGGRLLNAPLNEKERHPVILPSKHHAILLLVRDTHLQTLHGGPLVVQSVISRRFWIIRGRNFIRSVIRRCVKCVRFQGRTVEQQMGPLPPVRTRPSRPFTSTGVDYAGPFWVKSSPGRGRAVFKGYIAVFVCLVTKAAHIEVVSDYTSAAFLAAFYRFVARRGLCKVVFSDHGTNFKGADAELKRLFSQTSAFSQEVAAAIARDGTEWTYIPPNAPNFGGLWEATVKSFKKHFKRVVGETVLTFEELTTLATKIESCLNSRPISLLTSNDEDVVALTPGHFLIGSALISPPEPFEEINEEVTRCSRWHLISLMRNHFWTRWSQEYLSQLQERPKGQRARTNLIVGDIVLIKNELQPPTKWLMGRVNKVYPGCDGLCRVAQVRCAKSSYKRAVSSLVLLPVEEEKEPPPP